MVSTSQMALAEYPLQAELRNNKKDYICLEALQRCNFKKIKNLRLTRGS